MTRRYTVIGQPVAHSLSPVVHGLFADVCQLNIEYERTESTPDTFSDTVRNLQENGYSGCNITAPFKEVAASLCQQLSSAARLSGSVNTIAMHRDGSLHGDTTDGPGLVCDIVDNLKHTLSSKHILVLGAGGAVRGVIVSLLNQSPASLHIANRTQAKAQQLAELFADYGPVSASGMDAIPHDVRFDLVINAIAPAQVESIHLPLAMCTDNALAYDMNYAATDTPFKQWAERCGIRSVNGLGMLVEQAAESFLIWEGIRPDTQLVYPRLQQYLNQRESR